MHPCTLAGKASGDQTDPPAPPVVVVGSLTTGHYRLPRQAIVGLAECKIGIDGLQGCASATKWPVDLSKSVAILAAMITHQHQHNKLPGSVNHNCREALDTIQSKACRMSFNRQQKQQIYAHVRACIHTHMDALHPIYADFPAAAHCVATTRGKVMSTNTHMDALHSLCAGLFRAHTAAD
eukprot:1148663-Pelagomonas_calceolata.AAC.6